MTICLDPAAILVLDAAQTSGRLAIAKTANQAAAEKHNVDHTLT
jgi:hypothetical protein